MLQKLIIRNFKRFENVEIDLSHGVVFIGPNNAGKTSALQALALWELGIRKWQEKRGDRPASQKSGVAINRRDLFSLPIPEAILLWRDLHVRVGNTNSKQKTKNIRIDIVVEGVTSGNPWKCGLEFDYNNDETFYCRPLRLGEEMSPDRMEIPADVIGIRVAFLPPMSGLADREFIKQPGEITYLIGQGQTAQVLRNLCFRVCYPEGTPAANVSPEWDKLNKHLKELFGIVLDVPLFFPERSEIILKYTNAQGIQFDLSSAGRGLQQTLLILSYLLANPKTVLLLDEPDAHLEVLRQKQVFNLIVEIAETQESQLIAASHSEVVLNEAANKTQVVAFLGKPHTISNKTSQLSKALTEMGWDQYVQAEQNGWVLYLEDVTDLDILREFAVLLNHPCLAVLERPFVKFLSTNIPQQAREHFFCLKEAKPNLVGMAIFDHLEKNLSEHSDLIERMWARREIENYFCNEAVLFRWLENQQDNDLFGMADRDEDQKALRVAIDTIGEFQRLRGEGLWDPNSKASDDVLDLIFRKFSELRGKPLVIRKRDYFKLAQYMKKDEIDPEVKAKLDEILSVAQRARPLT